MEQQQQRHVPTGDNITLAHRARLLALMRGRTYEQLRLELDVWKVLRSVYINDGGVNFGLQCTDALSDFDAGNVYLLVGVHEDEERCARVGGYRLGGRVEPWDPARYLGAPPRSYALHLARTHYIQQEWVIGHAYYAAGDVEVLRALVERLRDTLAMLHVKLEGALDSLRGCLAPEARARIDAGRAEQEAAIPRLPPPRAAIPPDSAYEHASMMNDYDGSDGRDGWHESDVPQHRLFRLLVYIFMRWIIPEEIHLGGVYHAPSIRRHVVPRRLREMSEEERRWSGAVCMLEAADDLRRGDDTVRAVQKAYLASGGLHSASENLRLILSVLHRRRGADGRDEYALADREAMQNIAALKLANGLRLGPYVSGRPR